MIDAPRLWEIDHPYYCNEGNYYAADNRSHPIVFGTWSQFLDEFGNADFDLNLLFRWDWKEGEESPENSNFTGDPYYRNGTLLLFWMGQRKGLYFWSEISVCRADEDAVRAFLQPRLDHLIKLWAPLAPNAPLALAEDQA